MDQNIADKNKYQFEQFSTAKEGDITHSLSERIIPSDQNILFDMERS